MYAGSQWVAPVDRGIRVDAQEVLEASEALLEQFKERRSTYRRWGNEACALLSRLNQDVQLSQARHGLHA